MRNYSVLLVVVGAVSYGMPAPLMKMANESGDQTGGVIFFSFFISALVLNMISFKMKKNAFHITYKSRFKIMLSGIPIALTTSFYFASLNFIPVSVAVVMLMQSVWITQLLDYFLFGKPVSRRNFFSIILILSGTVLATNFIGEMQVLSITGLILSFLAAFSYACTIQITGRIKTNIPPLAKATLLRSGGCVVAMLLWYHDIQFDFLSYQIYWGGWISVFAIIIPAITFSAGMPKVSTGTGAIISSLELPCAIFFAWLFIGETIDLYATFGIVMILIAVICGSLSSRTGVNVSSQRGNK